MTDKQEPFAWVDAVALIHLAEVGFCHAELSAQQRRGQAPLYAAAPPAQPAEPVQRLSDMAVRSIWQNTDTGDIEDDIMSFARAIEAAIQPQGWVSVPVEPTLAYLRAVVVNANIWPAHDIDGVPNAMLEAALTYHRAMIEAAPKAKP